MGKSKKKKSKNKSIFKSIGCSRTGLYTTELQNETEQGNKKETDHVKTSFKRATGPTSCHPQTIEKYIYIQTLINLSSFFDICIKK